MVFSSLPQIKCIFGGSLLALLFLASCAPSAPQSASLPQLEPLPPSPAPNENFTAQLLEPSGDKLHTTNATGRIPFRVKFNSQFESGQVNQLTLFTNGATLFTTNLSAASLNAGEWKFSSNVSFSGAGQGRVGWKLISSNWRGTTVRSNQGSFIYSYRPQPVENLKIETIAPLNSKPQPEGQNTTVRVSWKAPAVQALGVGYELWWATNGAALQLVRTNAPLTHTSYSVAAKLGGLYALQVTVTNALGAAHYTATTVRGIKISNQLTQPPPPIYVVRFNTGGGSAIAATNIAEGGKVTPPPPPTRSDYTFGGWFANRALTTAFEFNTVKITSNTTLYAKWATALSYRVSELKVRYATNFYGDKTQPTLSWKVAAGSTATGQELWWGATSGGMTKLVDLGAAVRGYTVSSNRLGNITGQNIYYYQLKGTKDGAGAGSSALQTVTLRSCGAPQGGFTMVCSPATLEGINAKGLAGNYKLQNDLDLGGKVYDNSIIAPSSGGKISFLGTGFSGKFDGNGKLITNGALSASGRSWVGVFGLVTRGGVVSNLGVRLRQVSGSHNVGSLVGENQGTISRAHATGAVSGATYVGGLVGENEGSVRQSYATGAVSGSTGVSESGVGGLVGYNDGALSHTYATGAVSGRTKVGGLVGVNFGTILRSFATGSASLASEQGMVGGLVGENNGGNIVDAYATGAVSGAKQVGGLVGDTFNGAVNRVYAAGVVSRYGSTSANSFGKVFGEVYSTKVAGVYADRTRTLFAEADNPGNPTEVLFLSVSADNVASVFPEFNFYNADATWAWEEGKNLRRPFLRGMPPGAPQPTGAPPTAYTVSFSSEGGSLVNSQTVAAGRSATVPARPVRSGYVFWEWTKSLSSGEPFNFATAITADTRLHAKWIPLHSVTFSSGGGSAVAAQSITNGSNAVRPAANPTWTGRNFVNWFTTAAATTPFNFNAAITKATVVYAGWQLKTYAVAFLTNNGAPAFVSQSVKYGSNAARPADPADRAGFTFDGWYQDRSFTQVFNFGAKITTATTLYAKWIPIYTVSFNTDGGSAVAPQTVGSNRKATRPENPTKRGKFFTGWFTTAATNTVFNFDTARITSNTAVYAGWGDTGVTVTFNTGGGSSVAEQRLTSGEIATRPANPTSNGYAFLGWYLTSTALTAATPTFNFVTKITSNTALYAGWIQTFTVEFVTNQGGERVVWQSQTIRQGSNGTRAALPSPAPARFGYDFKGWFTTAATNTPFNFNAALNADATAYAAWQLKTYSVTFITNDGAPAFVSRRVQHGSRVAPPTAPVRAGYNFFGWFRDRQHTTAFNFNAAITANTTLYARQEVAYTASALSAGYPINFYGENTRPTLSWAVGAQSVFGGQELWWGESAAGLTKVSTLSAGARSFTVPGASVAAINAEKTYYWQVRGTNTAAALGVVLTNASALQTLTLRSCAAPQGGFIMVCSPYTLERINAKGLATNYKLQNHLNLGGKVYSVAIIAPQRSIGLAFNGTPFTGTFNGNGKTITNGAIRTALGYAGLFGEIGSGGVVSNLGVGLSISGRSYVGGLAGRNRGTVSYVYATGAVNNNIYGNIGGLIGQNLGTVSQAYATGAVTGGDYVGGLVGGNLGTVRRSYATGAVNFNFYFAGGLVGHNYDDSTLQNGYATGAIIRASGSLRDYGYVLGFPLGSISALYRRSGTFITPGSYDGGNTGNPVAVDFSTLTAGNVASKFPNLDFVNIWKWSPTLKRPVLRNMPAGAEGYGE